MRPLVPLVSLALAAALVSGCGDDSESEDATATPRQAIAEIAEVRRGLDEAVSVYRAGDATEAERLVEDAYLEHFEVVEGPLEEVDEELNEELEEAIREELTAMIADGASESDVVQRVREIEAGLDEAEELLQSAS